MPALPPVPSVIRVRWLLDENSDDEVGTSIFLQYSGAGGDTSDYDTFATAVATAWNTDLAAMTISTATLTTVTVEDLTSAGSPVGAATVSHAGTRSGGELPLSVAFSLQYHTLLRRRGGRWHGQHRMGTDTDLSTSQLWTTAFVTDVLTAWSSFMTSVLGSVWPGGTSLKHVGVQYYGPPNKLHVSGSGRTTTVSSLAGTPGADLTEPAVWPVSGYGAFTRLGSQRKRLGKSGT